MDNNLINIDDLMRQRLGGAREPELPGAWNRMEALLDKDDKRRPAIYWKRAMTYTGVALLFAAVSVGGYEMSSAFRERQDAVTGNSIAGNLPSGTTNPANGSVAEHNGPSASITTAGKTRSVTEAATTSNGVQAGTSASSSVARKNNRSAGRYKGNTAGNTNRTTAQNVADMPVVKGSTASNTVADKADNAITVAASTAKATNTGAVAGNNTINNNGHTNTNRGNTTANQSHITVLSSSVANTPASNTNTVAQKKNSRIVTTHNNAAKAPALAVNGNTVAGKKPANAIVKAGHVTTRTAAVNVKGGGVVTVNKPETVTKTREAVVAPTTPARPSIVSVSKPTEPIRVLPDKKVIDRIIMHKTTSGEPGKEVVTRMDTVSIDQIVMELKNNEAKKQEAATAMAEKQNATVDALKNSSSAVTGSKSTVSSKGGNVTPNVVASQTVGAKGTQGKANNTGNSTGVASVSSNSANGTANQHELAAQADLPPASATSPAASADQAIAAAPAAVNPEAAPASTENKPVLTKKKHGLNMAEGLSRMFNEVKYKIGGVQFAPGITAGINGTFFGPNSFKGFQFGMTGAFEMDEKWSLFTELKYFNRVNNNYAMYDYYNQYTPSGGGYKKDSTQLSFSFSTLHSFELPVSIRYTAGRFSFFGGANFMYALAINTGGVPEIIASVPSTTVATIGNNAIRNIEDKDFKSRFGVGYTVGLNCMVTPNLSFDFRNVQNVWDNSTTTGSQKVSKELYRSPSLQFSLMYRLGKGRDKE